MSDLVERLRYDQTLDCGCQTIQDEAADEIERLHDLHLQRTKSTRKALTERDECIERLRAALEGLCTCAQFGPMTICPACKALNPDD